MTTPRGYGWKVVPTADGYDVVDAYTNATAATAATRHDAWVAVAALSTARYAKEAA